MSLRPIPPGLAEAAQEAYELDGADATTDLVWRILRLRQRDEPTPPSGDLESNRVTADDVRWALIDAAKRLGDA